MEEIFRFTLESLIAALIAQATNKEGSSVTHFRGSNCGPSVNYGTNPCYLSQRIFGYITMLSQLCT